MFLVDMKFTNMDIVTPELTQQHRQYLADEYKKNKMLFGGRKEPRTGGLIVSNHQTKAELQQVLDSDPFISSGAADYSITEFIPVMASEQYAHLL